MFQAEKTHRFLSFWFSTKLPILKMEENLWKNTPENQGIWVFVPAVAYKCAGTYGKSLSLSG